MESLRCPVLIAALAVSLCSSLVLGDRKFGCLFEDELCAPYEFCVNDGVFGRCQELAGAQLYTYDISPSALERLRILLQRLAHRGLTWQDDITQQVISRELSKLRNVPLRHQATPLSPPDRPSAYSSSRDREVRPAQVELSKNLQQYLTGLGFLPQAEVDGQREGARVQNEDIKSDGHLESGWPKPQQGWKTTHVYSLQKGADHPPVTKVFTQSGEGRHPKLSATLSNQDPARSKLLSSQLERLLAVAPVAQQGSPGEEASWPKGKLHYLSYIRPALSENAKPQPQEAFGSKTQRPNLDRLLFKAGTNRLGAKEPLSVTDERFIQNVVNQLGRHSISMEALMGKDLDQLAEVITGALREADKQQPAAGVRPGEELLPPGGTRTKDILATKQQGQQVDGADKEPVDKHEAFFSKLLDYLNLENFGDAADVSAGRPAPLQKMVGLESVHSRTSQVQVPVPHRWEAKSVVAPAKMAPCCG
ncbi:unnamed protein product [Pleuronectes platessa]|uniref:RESP18 domain-containing protein n=1 Tax=Pleuronectes platessa TaxID=8262 RepID=A0A9N7TTP2_PLEPL|nr:unnamed protein product [Pleuronectes platessa]